MAVNRMIVLIPALGGLWLSRGFCWYSSLGEMDDKGWGLLLLECVDVNVDVVSMWDGLCCGDVG
jgi:hypothetical protein